MLKRMGFIFILVIASGIQAETTTLEPAKDNTLYVDAGGGLSNGAGIYLFAGRTGYRGESDLEYVSDHIRCADG